MEYTTDKEGRVYRITNVNGRLLVCMLMPGQKCSGIISQPRPAPQQPRRKEVKK